MPKKKGSGGTAMKSRPMPMKVPEYESGGTGKVFVSWNVNGLRAVAKKGFLEWLHAFSPDALCLQETKAEPAQLAPELAEPAGFHAAFAVSKRRGYSGTATFTKSPPTAVNASVGVQEFDDEGRTVITGFQGFDLVNVYVPNGRSDLSRVGFKLQFCDSLLQTCDLIRKQGRGVIVCGDFNTAHREIDLARPKENIENTGFLPEERAWIDKFLAAGYVDTFRLINPEQEGAYTWWDYKTAARERNVGWRLDYFFVSEDLAHRVSSAFILDEVEGSDHCPVGIEIEA